MNSTPHTDYRRYFAPGGLVQLGRHGMYEMAQTYECLRDVLDYSAHYVNFGYWPDGDATEEPGRELALLLGRELGLRPGARLLDAGCGLGQAAVDLTEHFDLSRVTAVNPCGPQMDFARELVQQAGLEDRVELVVDDAVEHVAALDDGSVDGAMMLECLSYFSDPLGFLSELNGRVLAPGGKVAFCVVTSDARQDRWGRRVVGYVSNAPSRPGAWFEDLMGQAGFVDVRREDITHQVITPVCARARRRLDEDPGRASRHHWAAGWVIRAMIRQAEASSAAGRMRYELLTGTRA